MAPNRGDKRVCKVTVELLALAHDRGCEAVNIVKHVNLLFTEMRIMHHIP
jgi:hypothetical protein